MRRKWMNHRNAAAALAALAGLSVSGSQALAHDDAGLGQFVSRLRGEYGLTTKYSCVRTPFLPPGTSGFDRPTGQLLVGGDVADAVGSGVMSFDPDGTVSVAVTGAELEQAKLLPGQAPVTTGVKYACEGTYTAQPDGQIAVNFPVCNVTSRPGVAVTVAPLDLEGYVARDRGTMVLSLIKGTVEKVAVSVGGNVVQERERICVATFSLSEIRGQRPAK